MGFGQNLIDRSRPDADLKGNAWSRATYACNQVGFSRPCREPVNLTKLIDHVNAEVWRGCDKDSPTASLVEIGKSKKRSRFL